MKFRWKIAQNQEDRIKQILRDERVGITGNKALSCRKGECPNLGQFKCKILRRSFIYESWVARYIGRFPSHLSVRKPLIQILCRCSLNSCSWMKEWMNYSFPNSILQRVTQQLIDKAGASIHNSLGWPLPPVTFHCSTGQARTACSAVTPTPSRWWSPFYEMHRSTLNSKSDFLKFSAGWD